MMESTWRRWIGPAARRSAAAALLLLLLAAVGAGGCQAGGADGERLSLTLSRRTTDGRHSLLELKPDGRLFFAGGRDAVAGDLHPAGVLSEQQRRAVGEVITRHGLTEASGSLFPKGNVVYRLHLNTGGLAPRIIHAADDDVPGLAELHDLLFQMQADVRYRIPGIE